MVDPHQDFYMRIAMRISAYADHPHEPHGSATAWPSLECWHEGPVVIGQPCFHVRLLRFGRKVWMAAPMNSRHVWRQSINFDMASRCSLSHTSLVGLARAASIASPSRSWLLSGQQQVVSGEVGEASRPVSLVSTFSALWPAPKAGHLGWGEPGHHRLHQVRPFFSSVWLGQ